MKKIILTIGIVAAGILASTNKAYAQEGFHIGIQATPQTSWLLNKDDQNNGNFEYLQTYNSSFGVSGMYLFSNGGGVGLDALYSMQGQSYKISGVERFKRTDYLKIPLMFVYSYNVSESIDLIGKIGPQAGILMDAKLQDKDGNNIISNQKSAYEDLNIGAVAVAGVGIKLAENFYLDALLRYDYDFTNAENTNMNAHINDGPLITNGGTGSPSRANTLNSTAGLTIGVRYVLK